MKIVHFGQKNCMTREGGVEIVVGEIAKRQVVQGHDVTCINRSSKHIANKNVNIRKINNWNGINMLYVPTIDIKGLAAVSSSFFASIIAGIGDYDIVHIHAEGPCFFSFIPKIFGKKVICHIHGLDWQRKKWNNGFASKFIKKGEKNLVKYADKIIVLSKALQKYFLKEYNKETIYIQNGVNKSNVLAPDIIYKKYNLVKDSYILYLSRLVPEKRCDLLIEAYNNLTTDKKLVIAGSSSDTDDYEKKLRDLSRDNKNIIFTGFVEGKELEELYSNAYIYVLPSDIEGMPLSLLEAMSYGNCCITSDIDECVDVIDNYGVSFKKNDCVDLKNKLLWLIDNPLEVDKYKNNVSNHVCDKYNWGDITKKITELYK